MKITIEIDVLALNLVTLALDEHCQTRKSWWRERFMDNEPRSLTLDRVRAELFQAQVQGLKARHGDPDANPQ